MSFRTPSRTNTKGGQDKHFVSLISSTEITSTDVIAEMSKTDLADDYFYKAQNKDIFVVANKILIPPVVFLIFFFLALDLLNFFVRWRLQVLDERKRQRRAERDERKRQRRAERLRLKKIAMRKKIRKWRKRAQQAEPDQDVPDITMDEVQSFIQRYVMGSLDSFWARPSRQDSNAPPAPMSEIDITRSGSTSESTSGTVSTPSSSSKYDVSTHDSSTHIVNGRDTPSSKTRHGSRTRIVKFHDTPSDKTVSGSRARIGKQRWKSLQSIIEDGNVRDRLSKSFDKQDDHST